jgi:hypothetical protein
VIERVRKRGDWSNLLKAMKPQEERFPEINDA